MRGYMPAPHNRPLEASTSSFSPPEITPSRADRPGYRAWLVGALEGACASLPLSLGCVVLVFGKLGPELIAGGMLATLLGLACLHLLTARSSRPIMYSARVFEATTLAAMLDQIGLQLPGWGLDDGANVRVALICLIGSGAGLTVGLLYLVQAQKLLQLIPKPVFAGFSNSIAVVLLISQTRMLWELSAPAAALPVVASVLIVSVAATVAARRWRPQWPSAALGLFAGLAIGLCWLAVGRTTPMVGAGGWQLALPVLQADFGALTVPEVKGWPLTLAIVGHAAILGVMIFVNTAMTSLQVTQRDGQGKNQRPGGLSLTLGILGAGAMGSAPLSGSLMPSMAAMRTTPLAPPLMIFTAGVVVAVYLSQVLGWVPLAAIGGALLCEAWFLVNQDSVRMLRDWLRRRPMPATEREDLALIAAVTGLAVLVNMVAAVFGGLMLGLLLFAMRNAQRPVRRVWTGAQLSSNCARSRADLRVLAAHGSDIRVFELEGDLFFAAAEGMDRSLQAGCDGAVAVILDWSRVRYIDSSFALSVVGFQRQALARGMHPIHAGADLQAGNVAAELLRRLPHARFTPDLDVALEVAENLVIQRYMAQTPQEVTSLLELVSLYQGMAPLEREQLDGAMVQKFFAAGDTIVAAGEPSDELMLLLHGSASIVVRDTQGKDIRLAGVRRGATLGEIGFLDRAPRSATIVAQEAVTVAVLHRTAYDSLAAQCPQIVHKLLANIALELATRLRHTNRLATARNASR